MKKFFLITVLVLFGLSKVQASHLIAGNIGYELLSYDSVTNQAQYEVNLITYQDCNSQFWGGQFPEQVIEIGIYSGIENPNNMPYIRSVNLSIKNQSPIVPQLGNNCSFSLSTCIYVVEYSAVVTLQGNNVGYHFIYERCCRPPGILNLVLSGDQGFTYRAWAAPVGTVPGKVENSSPVFTDTLIAYICIGDTSFLKNDAVDPDGDSLVYELMTPLKGYTGNGVGTNPAPTYNYTNGYSWPSPDILWAPGYNFNNMFGAGGYASISPTSGLTYFSASLVGLYVASVKISEYRNGVLIGVSRRDIQLLATNCPSNSSPVQSSFNSSTNNFNGDTFYIEAGDTFCLELEYEDLDGDNISYTKSGNVFNPAIANPMASGVFTKLSNSKVKFDFCWETSCTQFRNDPYYFRIEIIDDGCPPKLRIEEYVIYVSPPPVDSIRFDGPDTLCFTDSSLAQYQLLYTPASGYFNWTAQGANVNVFGQNASLDFYSNQVLLTVNALSDHGCIVGSDSMTVYYGWPLMANAGEDTIFCRGEEIIIGNSNLSSTGSPYSYNWTPPLGLSNAAVLNPEASPDSSTQYTLTVRDNLGCSETDQVNIDIWPTPDLEVSKDTTICFGERTRLWAQGTDSLYWSPGTWLNNRFIDDPWSKPDCTITYTAITTDSNGCITEKDVTVWVQEEHDFSLNISDLIFIGQEVVISVDNHQGLLVEWYLNNIKYCENCDSVERDFTMNQEVELFVSDTNNCFYYDTAFYLEVLDEFNVTIPSAFTPNGDGKNDIFYPVTFGIEELVRFIIYDRWGNLVFESFDIDAGWDGTYKGEIMPGNQVFVYRVIAKRYNGDEHQYLGRVTLVY